MTLYRDYYFLAIITNLAEDSNKSSVHDNIIILNCYIHTIIVIVYTHCLPISSANKIHIFLYLLIYVSYSHSPWSALVMYKH